MAQVRVSFELPTGKKVMMDGYLYQRIVELLRSLLDQNLISKKQFYVIYQGTRISPYLTFYDLQLNTVIGCFKLRLTYDQKQGVTEIVSPTTSQSKILKRPKIIKIQKSGLFEEQKPKPIQEPQKNKPPGQNNGISVQIYLLDKNTQPKVVDEAKMPKLKNTSLSKLLFEEGIRVEDYIVEINGKEAKNPKTAIETIHELYCNANNNTICVLLKSK